MDSDGDYLRIGSRNLAKGLGVKIGAYATFSDRDVEKAEGAEKALTEICTEAYHIAMLFCRTKTEFRWLQDPQIAQGRHFEEGQYEIVGSEKGRDGPKTMREARDILTVFGGVIKGAGDSKRIREEHVYLTKSYLMLL